MNTLTLITLFYLFNSCIGKPTISIVESIPVQVNLQTPGDTFSAWQDLISQARQSILFCEFYWTLGDGNQFPGIYDAWKGPAIIAAMEEAAMRNVEIRIVQNEPSSSMPDNDTITLAQMGVAQVRSLNWALLGPQLAGGILHNKLIVVDDIHVYIGSANMDWRSLTMVKELGVVIKDSPIIAGDARKLFEQFWFVAGNNNTLPETWPADFNSDFNIANPYVVQFGNLLDAAQVYLAVAPPQFATPGRTDAIGATLDVINNAQQFVDIEVMDYLPLSVYCSPKTYWGVLDDAIRSAAFRGVQVRMLVSHWNHTSPYTAQYLNSLATLNNLQLKWFVVPEIKGVPPVPFTRVNHAKFVSSETTTSVANWNWTGDYFTSTGGVSFVIKNPETAKQIDTIFARDWNSQYAFPLSAFSK